MNSDPATTRREGADNEIERLLDEREYAAITGRSIASARRDRLLGKGCPFVKLGFLVRYRPSDVRAYIARNVRGAQAEAPKSAGAEPRP
jgi:predicted DNA-binding transcriptional regulator AlpA